MAKAYSNRELDQFFKAADERADAFHKQLIGRMESFETKTGETLSRIEHQTTQTNGRVTTLEEEIVAVRVWRARIIGALAVLSFLVSAFLALFGAYLSTGYIHL